MKLFLAMMVVLAVAVVPALADQHMKGQTPGAGSGTSEPSKPAEKPADSGSAPSASPSQAPSASPGAADAPASKEDCKDFSKFTAQNFKSEAECVSWLEKKDKK